MKKTTKIGAGGLGLLGFCASVLVVVHIVFAAGTATVDLIPGTGTYAQGDTISLDIREDSGSDTVNAAQTNLTYPSNLLSFVGITSSSGFNIDAQSTGGGGTVHIGRGANPAVSGSQIVATVRFTVIGGGTANIDFAGGTAVVRSTDNGSEALTLNGGSYTLINPATIYLSPTTKTYTTGNAVDVAVYEDSGGTAVNAVQANLSYPSNLTFVSIDNNGSAFGTEAQNTGGNGSVKIGRGTITPVIGAKLVANVHFTAGSAGTAKISFATGTDVVRSTDNGSENLTETGASYTINSLSGSGSGSGSGGSGSTTTKPKTTTKTGSSGSKTTTNKSTTSTANKPPVTTNFDNKSPTISDIKVTHLGLTSATITWKTSEPSSSEVDYGLNTNYVLSAVDTKLVTNHAVALSSKEILPHHTYHFMVKSADADGNLVVSKDLSFIAEPPSKIGIRTGSFIIAFSVVLLIGTAAIVGANYIRRMHNEPPIIPPPPGSSGSGTGAVVPPDSADSSNVPADAIILNQVKPEPKPKPQPKPQSQPQPQPKPKPQAQPQPKAQAQPKSETKTQPNPTSKAPTKAEGEVPKQTDTPGTIIHPKSKP